MEKETLNQVPEYKKEVTFAKVFQVIFHRYPLLIGTTLVITLAGILAIKFGYNRQNSSYSCAFNYEIPSMEDGYLIDGSKFNYRVLADETTLSSIKSSKEDYSTIKVDSAIDQGKVSIIAEIKENSSKANSEDKESADIEYTLTVGSKFFSSASQAKSFIKDLVSYPITYSISSQSLMNYGSYLETYESSSTYDAQIEALLEEKDFIKEKYDSIKENYGNIVFENGENKGKTVSQVVLDFSNYFAKNSLDDLLNQERQKGYLANEDELTKLGLEKAQYEENIKVNNLEIDTLNASGLATGDEDYSKRISELAKENSEYQRKIALIDKKLENGDPSKTPSSFKAKIKEAYEYLKSSAASCKEDEANAIANHSTVYFVNSSIITVNGELSALYTYVLPLVGGFLIGAIANLIIDRKYLKEDYPSKKIK